MDAPGTAPKIGFPSVLAHAFFLQGAVYLVRPATSYKALELGVDPGLLGLVVASFSILPVFLAIAIGRATDMGREKQVLLGGAGLMLVAGAGLLFAAPSLPALLGWNAVLGVGHLMSIIGEQSRLASANARSMDRVFGFYTMVTAVAQAAAPLLLGAQMFTSAAIEFIWPVFGEQKFVTSTIFDIGVYLVVVGLVIDVLRSLGSEIDDRSEGRSPTDTHDMVSDADTGVGR